MSASLNTESRKPYSALNGIEKTRFTISAVVMAKSLNRRGLPRLPCLFCFQSAITSSSIQKVREPRLISALLYLFPVGCFVTRFRHEATTINGGGESRSDRSFLI